MTEKILNDLVGTPPPSIVDVKRIIRRQRRARWANGALVAVVTLAVVVGSVTLLRPSASPPTGPGVAADVDSAWLAATTRLFPGGQWLGIDKGMPPESAAPAMPQPPQLEPVDKGFTVAGYVRFGGDQLYFNFTAGVYDSPPRPRTCWQSDPCPQAELAYCPSGVSCELVPGPHGTVIKLERTATVITVTLSTQDRLRRVQFSIDNYPDAPPLSDARMIDFVTEPGLLP